jgi:CRP-like cAMP-binding protein
MQPKSRILEQIEIFRDLPQAEHERLAKRFRWTQYGAGEQIISHLDRSTDVFLVLQGEVRVVIYSLAGREVMFRDVKVGHYFGDLAAIDGLPRSASIFALSDSVIASMSADIFWEILRDYPETMARLIKDLAGLIRALTERVFEFSALAVNNRIHAELLRLACDHMTAENIATIQPAPTHAEIASRISTHREAVTRELSRLSSTGIVARRSGALVVEDVERLNRLMQDVIGY